jgi:hypothetical protein
VALHAIPNRWQVHRQSRLHLLFIVAGQAESLGRRGDQLDPGYIFADPHFVTAQATGGNRGVDRLPFALVFVALQALSRVHILFERDGVGLRYRRRDP